MNDVIVCCDLFSRLINHSRLSLYFSVSPLPAVVEVKSSLPSGMQGPLGTASEQQRGGGGEGGE